jgi:hypothetical protein
MTGGPAASARPDEAMRVKAGAAAADRGHRAGGQSNRRGRIALSSEQEGITAVGLSAGNII